MKRENKLVNKVKRLLRRLRCPRWLHHFGPKKYEFYEHISALIIRYYCRLSYRRTVKLLDLFGFICPSKSALQFTANKIRSALWNKILEITSGIKHHIIAIDSTGLSRTNPSYHYLRRIDGKIPKIPIKLSIAFDTKLKKFCSAKIRVLPSHDTQDVKALLRNLRFNILVADKGYDANWIHKYCYERNIKAHIPIRDYGTKIKKGYFTFRRKAIKHFRLRTYHRREIIESGNHSYKAKFGSSVNSKKATTIRSDVYGRLLCHNLFGLIIEIQDRAYCKNWKYLILYRLVFIYVKSASE